VRPLLAALGDSKFPTVHEPFCGGASVTLALVDNNVALRGRISDADRIVASFWISATEHHRHWKAAQPVTILEQGMQAFFLNRTSHSGNIHHGGVLGGPGQDEKLARGEQVKYPVGCRFNKESLKSSIQHIGVLHQRGILTASYGDYLECERDLRRGDLLYLDPPYVEKSDQLYGHTFTVEDHHRVAEFATRSARNGVHVIVSYDDVPFIHDLYTDPVWEEPTHPSFAYGMGSAHGKTTSREIMFSNLKLEI
jgi:DNA adenine methylase